MVGASARTLFKSDGSDTANVIYCALANPYASRRGHLRERLPRPPFPAGERESYSSLVSVSFMTLDRPDSQSWRGIVPSDQLRDNGQPHRHRGQQKVLEDHVPGKPWQKTDLFFLVAALARGMSSIEVAGFLGRDENEVEEMAIELRRPDIDPRRARIF
jgi:hypothetical protein